MKQVLCNVFHWGYHQHYTQGCQSERVTGPHARADEGETRKKRDLPVVNGRELEKRQQEWAGEAVFAEVKEKWPEGCYLTGK